MFDELHWLPLSARKQFKILTLIFKAQRGLAPKYHPHSAFSNRPLHSLNRLDLLVPRKSLSLDPLPQLVPLFGMHFLLLYTLLSFSQSFICLCLSQNLFFLIGPFTLAALLNDSSY